MKTRKNVWPLFAFIIALFCFSSLPDRRIDAEEGMFPISEIANLNLKAKGLEIDPSEIFNPNKTSLIDGICRVNGCTGSFVSPNGLIITNHHCAYRAIQGLSTADNDFLKDGFQAKNQDAELHATGYTVRITESYEDVSGKVLSVVTDDMTFADREKSITKRRSELEKEFEDKNAGLRAEVAEMFTGKTYVLFAYKFIKDVRLVFAPPASVGNFGGDVDNWEWPRHTGDFSFMRAYVAPDGSSADYAAENVPYQPKRFIQVARQGVNENDFVFLLGYPGRTARHRSASFLQYEQDIRLPYVVDLYQWQIEQMESAAAEDRSVLLKHTSRIQSLANVEKRSRGQLKGLKRAGIIGSRLAKEAELQKYIDADADRKAEYGNVLQDINRVYAEQSQNSQYDLNMQNLISATRALNMAFTIYDAAVERQKDDLDRESAYMDRNFPQTVQRLKLTQRDLHVPTDKVMLGGMLQRLSQTPGAKDIPVLKKIFDKTGDFSKVADEFFSGTKISDAAFIDECLKKSPEELIATNEVFFAMVAELYPSFVQMREKDKERSGQLSKLYGALLAVKMEFEKTSFVPDANATLRFTFGRVKGYSPEDAVYKMPITTLKGVVDKTTGEAPFITPQKILDKYAAKEFGRFMHPELKQIPVAFLYDTDTTGGNSGSPIINARGELVGVNFDRAFEATINDFAWNQSYSRSIGVDVRYALWITGDVFGAKHLLQEMGIE